MSPADVLHLVSILNPDEGYAIKAAHIFLDEPLSYASLDFCIKMYRDPNFRTGHELALQLAVWMQHPLLEQMHRRVMEERWRLQRAKAAEALRDREPRIRQMNFEGPPALLRRRGWTPSGNDW